MPIYEPGSNNTRVWDAERREWVPIGQYTDPRAQAVAAVEQAAQRLLGRKPTPQESSQWTNRIIQEGRTPSETALIIAGERARELATGKQDEKNQYRPGLSDPKTREDLRAFLRESAGQADVEMGQTDRAAIDPSFLLRQLIEEVPVSFLNPSLAVRREDVDTPEEATRYLQKHGGDTPINRELLRAALDYGGLSIEPTPFGTLSRPGKGLEWTRPSNEPGEIEERVLRAHADGSAPTPQELSAIAQERQGAFRLEDPKGIWRQIARAALTVPFAVAGGALGGATLGPAIGVLGASPGVATGIGSGIGAGVGGSALSGDPDLIWKSAVVGGFTGGLGAGLPGSSLPAKIAKGATIGGTTNLATQGLKGDGIDWTQLLQAAGTGAAGGAASGIGPSFPGEDILLKLSGRLGTSLLRGNDPLQDVNAQLDRNALQRAQDQQAALQARQEEWKRQYAAASAEARAAQLEAFRSAQQEWESKKAEYEAKLQAFLDERSAQIEEALRAMGLAEPGIAGLLSERQRQIEAAQADQAAQQAALVESRTFFPSELLAQTGDTGASSLLVPHSPPPVLFGQEGLPASFADYAQAQTPQFSSEGFLPSGSLAESPAVAPMGADRRPPRYFPTLLGGLARSPYLRYG